MIWIVAELDLMFPNSGAVIGVFTDEKLAREFCINRMKETSKVVSITEWKENETIPIGERGVI